jgi:integrase
MIKIRDKAAGVWWCDFRTPTGERVRKSLGTKDKKEAKQLESQLMAQADEKAKKGRGGITLKEAYAHAWRVRKKWIAAKSRHSIDLVYGWVVDRFGEDCPLSRIDDEAVLKYGEDMLKKGLSASTINKRLSMISVLFDEAKARGKYSGHKPNTDHFQVSNGRMRLVTPEEEATALRILRSKNTDWTNALADLVVVLADTGARLSEALNITSSRVNVEQRAVLLMDTKNGDNRVVPLTDRALEVLIRRSELPKMFHPLGVDSSERIWARVRKQMGLEDDTEFVLHALRHTFASTLANAGVDAFRIQKVMGHRSITTTERYVKVSTASLDGLADIMTDRCTPKRAQKAEKEPTLGDVLSGETGCDSIGYTFMRENLKSVWANARKAP